MQLKLKGTVRPPPTLNRIARPPPPSVYFGGKTAPTARPYGVSSNTFHTLISLFYYDIDLF
jgi:hypothetical protein